VTWHCVHGEVEGITTDCSGVPQGVWCGRRVASGYQLCSLYQPFHNIYTPKALLPHTLSSLQAQAQNTIIIKQIMYVHSQTQHCIFLPYWLPFSAITTIIIRSIICRKLKKRLFTHSVRNVKLCGIIFTVVIDPLKPTGHVMNQQFNIQQLYALPTLYLCILYLSENKQRLVPLTA